MVDSNRNTIVTAEDAGEFESDFVTKNQKTLSHFRRSGLYLVEWKHKTYKASPEKLLCFYIMWYLAEIACFGIAGGIKEAFKPDNFKNRVNDFIEASFVVIVIGVLPAFWIFLLREYNNNLPQILNTIGQLEKTKIYERLEIHKNPVISFREGFLDEDYNDKEDEDNIEAAKIEWWPVKYGPIFALIASVILCLILVLLSFIEDIQKLIEAKEDALKHVKKELPFFIMSILYPIPYFIGIWFCVFFLEWQRKLYESIRHLIREIRKSRFQESGNTIVTLLRTIKAFSLIEEPTNDTSVHMDPKEESENTEIIKSEERLPVDQQEELDIVEKTANETRQPPEENKELQTIERTTSSRRLSVHRKKSIDDTLNKVQKAFLYGNKKVPVDQQEELDIANETSQPTEENKELKTNKRNTSSTKLSETQKSELDSIDDTLNKVQKAFSLLNKKVFQKTIVLGFVVFMFMGVFCCWKVLQASSNFAYILPLLFSNAHIYLACKWSNDLMKEYQETIEVLNEMHEEDVEDMRRELDKSPPQVYAFGGFSVNYSMMTAVLAFIISCIGIPEEMWPEDNEHCYTFDVGTGNQTLCINKNLFIEANNSLCLRINQTLCLRS